MAGIMSSGWCFITSRNSAFQQLIAKLMLFKQPKPSSIFLSAMVIGVVISIYYYFGGSHYCFEPRSRFDDEEVPQDQWIKLDQWVC